MTSKATTVAQYLKELPEDRRSAITAIRETILKNLDKGFQENMQYGMIGYSVPHSIYPGGYHCDPKQPLPFAGIGSQKNGISIHLLCIYFDQELASWFKSEWIKTGKKLDMGKGCVRVKSLDEIPLALLGKAIKKMKLKSFLAQYEALKPKKKQRA